MRLSEKRKLFAGDFAALINFAVVDLGLWIVIEEVKRSTQAAEWNATHCRVVQGGKRCEMHAEAWPHTSRTAEAFHSFKPIGIRNSLHIDGLAGDILILEDKGTSISNDRKTYEKLGFFWKAIRPENCWGGDFKGFSDLGHFSREHEGRK